MDDLSGEQPAGYVYVCHIFEDIGNMIYEEVEWRAGKEY